MKKNKKQTRKIFVTLVILILIALATGIPNVSASWTSDAPITVDTVVKKEGTGSIKVESNQTSPGWINDSSIESGLSPALFLIAPEVFKKDSTWHLITTDWTDFYGYNWTGSTWQSDNGIISGLYSAPSGWIFSNAVFYKDSTWYLIADNDTGYCYGYNWTGSAWQNDSAIISGLNSIGNYASIDIFQKGGIWYLISGNSGGTFTGYNWSGSIWQSDSAIVNGLGDIGSYSNPSIFYKDSTWFLIAGENGGDFFGFKWNGASWASNSSITEGLYDIGICSYPNAFEGGNDFGDVSWYLLSVEENNGNWEGFNWDSYTPTCYFQNDFSPPISVTNVSKNAGYLALWYFIYDASKINSNVKISIYTDDSNYMYWEVSKTYFENGWNEVYLPLSEGTEVGTLSLSSISKFKLEIPGTEDPNMVHRVDYMRFVEYPYTLHNIYMQLDTDYEGGAGTYFPPPHLVEFRVQNIYGSPISDVTVTAQGYETTMGALSWLYSIFGYRNETRIHNTTMEGTTDTLGHLSFMMVEPIKYKVDFVKESEGINTTMYFYPKESQYQIVLTPTTKPDMIDYVTWNLSVEIINSSYSSLNITYNDDMSKTTNLCFFVKDVNKTEICNTCFPGDSSVDTGYTLKKESGVSYFWGFNVSHETFGDFTQAKAVTFKSRLLDLQLENEAYYTWISIAILFAMTSLFSFTTAKFGYVVIPFMSGILYYVGWLTIPITLLTVIIILGVLLYMGKQEREKNL